MDEQQLQQQIAQLVQAAMQGDEQATQQIQQIMQAAQQGDQQATQLAQMIQDVAQQMQQQQVQAAKFGAKLNYIKQLRGVCPDGYEMQYFKAGGAMGSKIVKECVKCQKQEAGGKAAPKNLVEAFKEERTLKKKASGESVKPLKKTQGDKVKKARGGDQLEYDYSEWDNPNGNGLITSETLVAKPGFENNKEIGDRRVYRWINGPDTTFSVYPKKGYYGLEDPQTPTVNPIAVYDKTTPNYRPLQALFDKYKKSNNKRK